ncbi:MAG: hypothetical protein IPL61_04770 [Myxococcales bacterium]|nr:hypothetical protein [Myxococcales bacterium]
MAGGGLGPGPYQRLHQEAGDMKTQLVQIASIVTLVAACGLDATVPPVGATAQAVIDDAAHGGLNEHFYFLPSLVPAPTVSGVFDPDLAPTVEICELDAGAPAWARSPRTIWWAAPAGTLSVDLAAEAYHVNWHTTDSELRSDTNYRIMVFAEAQLLGFADVDVVDSGRQLRNVNTAEFIPLLDGRTLPIKFRIEEGAIDDVVDPCAGPVAFADPALEAVVRTALGLPSGELRGPDLAGLTVLNAPSLGITSLEGLACATNLVNVYLTNTELTDLGPLAGATQLRDVYLDGNAGIADLGPLASATGATRALRGAEQGDRLRHGSVAAGRHDEPPGRLGRASERQRSVRARGQGAAGEHLLHEQRADRPGAAGGATQLRDVYLDGNAGIADLGPLASATGATRVRFAARSKATGYVTDLSPLAGMTNLQVVSAEHQSVSDLSALAGKAQLANIYFTNNELTDLGPLAGATQLRDVYLDGNAGIADLGPLASATGATRVRVNARSKATGFITDLAPLASMTALQVLSVDRQAISDITLLAGQPTLRQVFVVENEITDLSPLAGACYLTDLRTQLNPYACPDPTVLALRACGVNVGSSCP